MKGTEPSMTWGRIQLWTALLPGMLAGLLAGLLAMAWLERSSREEPALRLPGQAPRPPAAAAPADANPGTLVTGSGSPSERTGSWPQFRGPDRSGIGPAAGLERLLAGKDPKPLWSVPVCDGYAGPVIAGGRVFLLDHDREKREDALRCLSLEDGAELWRYTYYARIKRNHGITRTTPAVAGGFVVTLSPLCRVLCLEAETGRRRWELDLVAEQGTKVPQWYAGQCPLIDGQSAILAPGGKALLMAVDLATGATRWATPNPHGWGMTHSSIIKLEYGGVEQFVYCHTEGVAGVAAEDGRLLWNHPDWKISIANVPTPVLLPDQRILLTGGYNAGSALLQLSGPAQAPLVTELFRLDASVFGADQQTPIFYKGHVYGVIPGGRLACIDLEGRRLWLADQGPDFGLGPYILAGETLLVVEGTTGRLHLVPARPDRFESLGSCAPLSGREIWAPLALAAGRLLIRNHTELVCIDVS